MKISVTNKQIEIPINETFTSHNIKIISFRVHSILLLISNMTNYKSPRANCTCLHVQMIVSLFSLAEDRRMLTSLTLGILGVGSISTESKIFKIFFDLLSFLKNIIILKKYYYHFKKMLLNRMSCKGKILHCSF